MPYCKKCGAGVWPSESFCSSCGEVILKSGDFPSAKSKLRKMFPMLIAVSLLIVAGTVALLYFRLSSPYITVPGKYSTICEAIDAAKDGDVIVVEPGIYRENIDFKGKEITLRSIDPDDPEVVAATVIEGGRNGSVVTFCSKEREETSISGFTITRGSGTWLALEYEEDGEQVELKGFFGGGILVLNGSSPNIKNNIIQGNKCAGEGGGGGIAIWDASAVMVGNTICGNRAASGGGIFVGGSSVADIKINNISENNAVNGGGIFVGMKSSVSIEENTIGDNKAECVEML